METLLMIPNEDDPGMEPRKWDLKALLDDEDEADFEIRTNARKSRRSLQEDEVEIIAKPSILERRKRAASTTKKDSETKRRPLLLEGFEDDFEVILNKPITRNKLPTKENNHGRGSLYFSTPEYPLIIGLSILFSFLSVGVLWKWRWNMVLGNRYKREQLNVAMAKTEGSIRKDTSSPKGSRFSDVDKQSERSSPTAPSPKEPVANDLNTVLISSPDPVDDRHRKRKSEFEVVAKGLAKLQRSDAILPPLCKESGQTEPQLVERNDRSSCNVALDGTDCIETKRNTLQNESKINDSSSPLPQPIAGPELPVEIQHLQNTFERLKIGSTMAQELAISLRCSQSLWSQEGWLERKEKSSFWDPDWKDKLRNRRDRCWDSACRLIFDITLAHVLLSSAKPVLEVIFAGGDSWQPSAQILQLAASNFCGCSGNHYSTLAADGQGTAWAYIVSPTGLLWSLWGWDSILVLEECVCYGHCIYRFGMLSIITLIFHQILRAFSFPGVIHHATNAFAISLAYRGPSPWHLIYQVQVGILMIFAGSFVAVLGLVQWSYLSMHKLVKNSTDFRKAWDHCIDRMDELQARIVVTRYAALSIIGYLLWSSSQLQETSVENEPTAIVVVA